MLLSDIKVVEIGQVLSAPYAAAILSDLGAQVIKIEKPGGDEMRHMGPPLGTRAPMTFQDVNRGKQSVVLDLKVEQGRQHLFKLLADADILIHNIRPGDAVKLGVDADAVRARFPRLIYCEISAFGHEGPRRLQPGYESLLQAFSGLIDITGDPDGKPARMGASVVDQGTALWTALAALAALHRRHRTGEGETIRASLLETSVFWASHHIHAHLNEGRPSGRHGTAHPNAAPYQVFDGQDGPFMICANSDRLFAKLAVALGRPEWATDPLFQASRRRLQNRDALVSAMQALLATRPRRHWIDLLTQAGVPAAPVNTIAESLEEEQVKALGMIRPLAGSDIQLAGVPVTFGGKRPEPQGLAPELGADNERYRPLFGE